jgi:hypothetical protein
MGNTSLSAGAPFAKTAEREAIFLTAVTKQLSASQFLRCVVTAASSKRKAAGHNFEFFPHFLQDEKGSNKKRNGETLTEIAKAPTQILVQRHEHCC